MSDPFELPSWNTDQVLIWIAGRNPEAVYMAADPQDPRSPRSVWMSFPAGRRLHTEQQLLLRLQGGSSQHAMRTGQSRQIGLMALR
jgi:hypothetical protein